MPLNIWLLFFMINLSQLQIKNLADYPEYISIVSQWLWEEWDKKEGHKLEHIEYRTRNALKRNDIPQTLIAVYDGKLVGTVSIWNNDLKSRQDLRPWLSALFVKKEYRNNGIGTALQKAVIEEVKKLEYSTLYLITDLNNYYEQMGWKFLEKAPLENGKMTSIYEYQIMNKDFCPEPKLAPGTGIKSMFNIQYSKRV